MIKMAFMLMALCCLLISGCASTPNIAEIKESAIKGDREAFQTLIENLKAKNSLVRKESALALGEIGDKSSGPHLVVVLNDGEPDVRDAATEALSRIGYSKAVPEISKALYTEGCRCCRVTMAKAINNLNPSFNWEMHKDLKFYLKKEIAETCTTESEKLDVEVERLSCNIQFLGEIGSVSDTELLNSCRKIIPYYKRTYSTEKSAYGAGLYGPGPYIEKTIVWRQLSLEVTDLNTVIDLSMQRINERSKKH